MWNKTKFMPKKMEDLIEAVKKHKALWDISSKAYKDHTKRLAAWKVVAEECGIPKESVKSKWRGIRDTYIKFLKADKRASELGRKKRKAYCYADQMEFMKHILLNAKTQGPRDPLNNSGKCVQSGVEILPPQVVEYRMQEVTESQPHKDLRQISDNENESFELLRNNRRADEVDATDLLFQSYAKILKTFTRRRQILLKKKIADIFSEAELEEVSEEEAEFVTSCAPYSNTVVETTECKIEPNCEQST